jgi:hypothetical protein
MVRVSAGLVLVSDNLFGGEGLEQAEKLRDPSHVRNYTEAEWRDFLGAAGARVSVAETIEHPVEIQGWLDRAGCTGADAQRVLELVAERTRSDRVVLDRIVIKAEKAKA